MTIIFADTNTYLHGKPLQDIPWELREQVPITILVTKTVIRELDKHKDQHPKKHIRERARKALQRIEAAPTVLRPNVQLRIEQRRPRIDYDAYDLDESNPDDQLIASIINYREEHPGDAIVLYTHDVGPRLTAAQHGISAKPLVTEDQLPPQKDETERENEHLRKALHELQMAAPQLSITINDQSGEITVATLGPAPSARDDAEIDRESIAARDDLPDPQRRMIVDHDPITRAIAGNSFGTPASEYERYEREKAGYRAEYQGYLRDVHDACDRRSRTVKLDLVLRNDGGKPAEDITITVIAPENVTISTEPPLPPSPPAPPILPRTQTALHLEALNRIAPTAYPYAHNPLADLNPWRSGPDMNGTQVRWWYKILNHRFTHDLGTLYLEAEQLTPLIISYNIHAANSITPFTGVILIRPRQAAASNDQGSAD